MDKLADWTADFNLNLGFELPQTDPNTDIKIKDMELIRYEKYDYVMIVCRNEIDYLNLTRALGIDGKKVLVAKGKNGERKIKARAIWYDEMKAKIVPDNNDSMEPINVLITCSNIHVKNMIDCLKTITKEQKLMCIVSIQ